MNTLKKINKKDIEDIIALTPTQEGMLYHYLKDPDSDYYFEQLSLIITGEINFNCFKQAWDFVVETNEVLRSCFRWDMVKKPVQIILKRHQPQVVFHDFSSRGIKENDKLKLIEEIKEKDRKNRFDLNSVPFRVLLCKIHECRYEMIISNHHILYDGWSNRIILKEFFSSYMDLLRQKSPGKPVKHRYKEYTPGIQRQDRDKLRKYWTGYLKGFEGQAQLSIKKKRGTNINAAPTGNSNCKVKFSRQLKEKSGIFTKHHKITLACLLYSAWGLLLQGYNNSEDVIFGTTVSGRSPGSEGIEDIVGLFINTVPLRVRTNSNGHEKVKDFLSRVNQNLREMEAYESVSLVEIKEYGGGGFEEELFDTIFVIENYPLHQVFAARNNPGALSIDSYSIFETTHYDLTVGVTLMDDIEIEFTYNKDLFEESIITGLPRHFIKIVEEMVNNPGKELAALEMLADTEKNKILYEFNNTNADYPGDKTIHQLFARQVERNPDHIALIGQSSKHEGTRGLALLSDLVSMTYRELDKQSDGLACILTGRGVGDDAIVGIMVERSIEMVIGILGMLKAGGAYLPIGTDYPRERIRYMLADSNVKIVFTTPGLTKKFEKLLIVNCQLLIVNERTHYSRRLNNPLKETNSIKSCQLTINNLQLKGNTLAYIIYTSGTTGRPKGVMVEHAAVVNRLNWVRDQYRLNEGDVILQAASFVFDVSVCEMFRWIPAGGRLYLLPAGAEKDPGQIIKTIARNNVTTADFIPAMLTLLLEYVQRENLAKELTRLRWVWTGVEAVNVELVKEFNETLHRLNRTRLINAYGPTESTVDVTYFDCSHITAYDAVPIGRPMANIRVYILSINGVVQPVGVYGQLCIAGKGLARGYLNNPGLTAEKFNHDLWDYQDYHDYVVPFGQILNAFGEKIKNKKVPGKGNYGNYRSYRSHRSYIYRTGDLARWLADGNIQFLGRMDHQAKIRGHRVELGEIESYLLRYKKIKEAVVIVGGGNENEKYLCAYIVPHSPGTLSIDDVKTYLSLRAPTYMVPAYFVTLAGLPMTSAGKIDRRALPHPKVTSAKPYTAPGNQKEVQLVDIWAEVLGIDSVGIGIDDNFFELGGHSLKILGVIGRIHKRLNIKIPFTGIFAAPTIRELARYVSKKERSRYETVPLAEKKEYYNLSSVQRRLYFLYRMTPHGITYNMSGCMRMEGPIEAEKLETVFQKLIARHESLRTSFVVKGEEPCQRIHDERNIDFWVTSYRLTTNNKLPVKKMIENFIRPFDLSRVPLLRVGLIEEKYREYILVVDMHHIISDGTSMDILARDFMAIYNDETLPGFRIQYKDFSSWQNNEKVKDSMHHQEAYWLKKFEKEIPILNLPTDYRRASIQSYEGNRISFELDHQELRALKDYASKEGVTLFMVLLATYNIFLSKVGNQEDIIVGTPVQGRRHSDLEPIIGMFVNTLALRNYPTGNKTFNGFLHEIRQTTLRDFENQDYPFEDLVEKVSLVRYPGRNPLFDTMFAMQKIERTGIEIPGLKLTSYDYESNVSKFDITLQVLEIDERLNFTFEYSSRLFKKETIQRFIGYLDKIISTVLVKRDIKISEIDILSEEEKKRILLEFNDTGVEYPRDKTISQLFAEQVEQRPDNIALIGKLQNTNYKQDGAIRADFDTFGENILLTYRELNHQSYRLAGILRGKGVKSDIIVGIMVERSIEMIIGILGILKAGGAYMPLNPLTPVSRNEYLMKECNTGILLTTRSMIEEDKKVRRWEGEHIFLEDQEKVESFHAPCPMPHSNPEHLAYVIFTSGSTGNPKGVHITHANLSPLLYWGYRQLGPGPSHRVIQNLSYYFDWSVWEIFITITTGAALIIATREVLLNSRLFADFIDKHNITALHITPSQYQYLVQTGRPLEILQYLFIGAEKLTLDLAKQSFQLIKEGCRVFNMYGPTECTIITSVLEINPNAVDVYRELTSVPIGSPVANVDYLVLDKYLKPCPFMVNGELYIAGDGLTAGYINDPEKTRGAFFPNIYEGEGITGSRLYKTGDIARWLPDGNVEYLGRIDLQVKIRGYRIELGEIESRLLKHKDVSDAVVLVNEDAAHDKYICAYFVPGEAVSTVELKQYLQQRLPYYMVPSYFMQIEKIPLNPNGKIDRKALPIPVLKADETFAPPGDEIQKLLVEIWSDLTGIEKEKISIDANLFELGGHSLKIMALASRINKEFNVTVPFGEIFKIPVIRRLAIYIKKSSRGKSISIENSEKKEYHELSSAQKRLFIIEKTSSDLNTAYNLPMVILTRGNLDKFCFERTFQTLVKRHDSLRTSFALKNGKAVQIVHDDVDFKIKYSSIKENDSLRDVTTFPLNDRITRAIAAFIKSFDISNPPLLRIEIVELNDKRHILLFDMHHIVSDGLSMVILVREFICLYEGAVLPALRIQYKDFTGWQNKRFESGVIKKQEDYWLNRFKGDIPVLKIKTDFPRPAVKHFEGDCLTLEIDEKLTGKVKQMMSKTRTTLFQVLLAAFNILLSQYTRQQDIIVGVPIAGRNHADLESIIGMFVNTLPVRIYQREDWGFLEFLAEVKKNLLEAYENQDYPLEELVKKLGIPKDLSRNPLFDVLFVSENLDIPELAAKGLEFHPYEFENKITHLDLVLYFEETANKIRLKLEYSTRLFKGETILTMLEHYIEIVEQIVDNREICIKDIRLSHDFSPAQTTVLQENKIEFAF